MFSRRHIMFVLRSDVPAPRCPLEFRDVVIAGRYSSTNYRRHEPTRFWIDTDRSHWHKRG